MGVGVGGLRLRPLFVPSIAVPSRPSRLLWINQSTDLLFFSLSSPSPMMIWLSIIAMPASARPSAFLRPKFINPGRQSGGHAFVPLAGGAGRWNTEHFKSKKQKSRSRSRESQRERGRASSQICSGDSTLSPVKSYRKLRAINEFKLLLDWWDSGVCPRHAHCLRSY